MSYLELSRHSHLFSEFDQSSVSALTTACLKKFLKKEASLTKIKRSTNLSVNTYLEAVWQDDNLAKQPQSTSKLPARAHDFPSYRLLTRSVVLGLNSLPWSRPLKVVGYSYNHHATIAPVGTLAWQVKIVVFRVKHRVNYWCLFFLSGLCIIFCHCES